MSWSKIFFVLLFSDTEDDVITQPLAQFCIKLLYVFVVAHFVVSFLSFEQFP